MANNHKPKNHNAVSPYLIVSDAQSTLDFLTTVFDAEVLDQFKDKEGRLAHAEVRIDDSIIMMGQASGDYPPMPCMVHIYVPDVDETYQRALAQGATSVREPRDEFYGDRSGGVKDAQGFQWWMATHKEDLSSEELQKRAEEAGK